MNYAIGIVGVAFGATYLWFAQQIRIPSFGGPINGQIFPNILGIVFILISCTFLIPRRKSAISLDSPADNESEAPVDLVALGAIVGWIVLYYLTFQFLGFILSTFIFLLGLLTYFHRGWRKTNLAVAVIFPLLGYYLFARALGLWLPVGVLGIG